MSIFFRPYAEVHGSETLSIRSDSLTTADEAAEDSNGHSGDCNAGPHTMRFRYLASEAGPDS